MTPYTGLIEFPDVGGTNAYMGVMAIDAGEI
jgi:hypothetical protein